MLATINVGILLDVLKINIFLIKLILIILLFCSEAYRQNLHHQMLSSQGDSKVLPNEMYVSQTIGQQSVSGNYSLQVC